MTDKPGQREDVQSRSQQKRVAAMKGEPYPETGQRVEDLPGKDGLMILAVQDIICDVMMDSTREQNSIQMTRLKVWNHIDKLLAALALRGDERAIRISDLDLETRTLIVATKAYMKFPSMVARERVESAIKRFDAKHSVEQADNLLKALREEEVAARGGDERERDVMQVNLEAFLSQKCIWNGSDWVKPNKETLENLLDYMGRWQKIERSEGDERATVIEECAAILDAEVREHREKSPQCSQPYPFCEDYGCFSLEELATKIRALKTTARGGDERERKEYKHWGWCNGDRRVPAGEPGHSCCCFNAASVGKGLVGPDYTERGGDERELRAFYERFYPVGPNTQYDEINAALRALAVHPAPSPCGGDERELQELIGAAAKLRIDHYTFPPHIVHNEDANHEVLAYDQNCVACVIPKLLRALAAHPAPAGAGERSQK